MKTTPYKPIGFTIGSLIWLPFNATIWGWDRSITVCVLMLMGAWAAWLTQWISERLSQSNETQQNKDDPPLQAMEGRQNNASQLTIHDLPQPEL
jgi:hypothetical protein